MIRREMIALLVPALLAAPHWKERASMPLPRAGCIAGVSAGRMLVAGGSYWEGGRKITSARSDWFDPRLDRWTAAPPLPAPRSDAASATTDTVYAIGGVVEGALTASVLRFDGSEWSEMPAAALPAPTMYAIAEAEGSDIFLYGGLAQLGDLASATRTLRRWRPGGAWTSLAPFPGASRVSAAVTIHHGKLYVFGGVHQEPGREIENLADAWAYDIAENRWRALGPLPVACRAWRAVSSGGSIFLLGGYTDAFSAAIYEFRPGTGVLKAAGQLPHPLADTRFVRMGGRVFNAGGETAPQVRAPWTLEATL